MKISFKNINRLLFTTFSYVLKTMFKHSFCCIFTMFSLIQCLTAQTYPISTLPKNAQKALDKYIFVESASFFKGLIGGGTDSLQWDLVKRVKVESFNINRFEVTVEEYQKFYTSTDTLLNKPKFNIWTEEFPYSYNEPMIKGYFSDIKYKDYPIVGVTWQQAVRYCQWQTNQVNDLLKNTNFRIEIRLPTEAEWEMAALFKKPEKNNERITDRRIFPWEGAFFEYSNKRGFRFACNGGPIRTAQNFYLSIYHNDGYMYTAPVKTFKANDLGLYQMAGNVAEWTSDFYSIDTNRLAERYNERLEIYNNELAMMKPTYDTTIIEKKIDPITYDMTIRYKIIEKRVLFEPSYASLAALKAELLTPFPVNRYDSYKIIKGGSWSDEPFYLQSGVKKIFHPDRSSATIGFRPVCIIRKKGD